MVKKYSIKIIALLIFCFTVFISKAQSQEELVKKDYPKLYNDFKKELGGQNANYITKANNKFFGKYNTLKAKFKVKNPLLDIKVWGQQLEGMF
jgi:hypothetical protein